jgi:tetratricopeptide (TPR) repeat protein
LSEQIDFFISRRGESALAAQEVAEVLKDEGYTVLVQDYDIPYASDFIAAMHDALKRCRHLIVLLTKDYGASDFTMMEVTNFLAAAGRAADERRLVVLRIAECEPDGILAGRVYGDLVGVADEKERRARILAAAEGRSTATPRRPKLFENVPPRDRNFTGRGDRLVELHGLLVNCDAPAPVAAVHGLGGIGKSSLAAEYAHRYAADYSGVWWAPAEQRLLLISSLSALAAKLDTSLANEPDQEKAARAGLAHLRRFTTPFLLVYDNVETPESLRDLVPSAGARVLTTTRWTDWAGHAAEVRLDLLGADAATEFLQSRAGRADPEGARRLAAALGFLPLALDHAGAYCRLAGPAMSFDAYRQKIDARISRAPRGYPDSVAKTFSMAIEKAAGQHAAAETLLALLAFLAPDQVPLDLVTGKIMDEDDRTDALMALSAVSLIEHQALDDGSAAVAVHRLVQAAMRAQLMSQGKALPALEAALDCLAEAAPEGVYDEPRHWPRCARLLPHVLTLRAHVAGTDHKNESLKRESFALLNDRMGEFLYARASLDLAKTFFTSAIEVGKFAFGSRHAAVAKSMNNLANVLRDVGSRDEAEPLLRAALDIQLESSGADHPGYARTLTTLAGLLHESGRLAEAESLLRAAIALGEKNLGRPHPDVAMRLNNLATLLRSKGERAEAEALFRESIQSGERTLGREHPHMLARLSNLALILHGDGRHDEAEALYREAIENGERNLGPEHPHVAVCLQNLANLCRDVGRASEAEPLYVRALAIFAEKIGADHVNTARVRSNFARLLLAIERVEAAREYANCALLVHERMLGPDHPWTQDSVAIVAAAVEASAAVHERMAGDSA